MRAFDRDLSGMRGENCPEWGKFSTAEIAGLNDKADLVAQVQTKYESTGRRRNVTSTPSLKVGSFKSRCA